MQDAIAVHFDRAQRVRLIMRKGYPFRPVQRGAVYRTIREAALAGLAYHQLTGSVESFKPVKLPL